jgi:hypothetical protein
MRIGDTKNCHAPPCRGLWGRLWGHDVREFTIEKHPDERVRYDLEVRGSAFSDFLEFKTYRKNIIACKRCGWRPD